MSLYPLGYFSLGNSYILFRLRGRFLYIQIKDFYFTYSLNVLPISFDLCS